MGVFEGPKSIGYTGSPRDTKDPKGTKGTWAPGHTEDTGGPWLAGGTGVNEGAGGTEDTWSTGGTKTGYQFYTIPILLTLVQLLFFLETSSSDCFNIIIAQKMNFSIKDFFSKCEQIRMKLRILSHLMKKSLKENFIFCALNKRSFEYVIMNK